MAESSINITEGSGKRAHTFDRTISSVLVQEQAFFPAEFPYATYIASASGVGGTNAGDDLLQVMAGSSLHVRVRRIRVEQNALITTAATCLFTVARLTSAGTGGTGVTPSKFDNGDAASGASAMSGVPLATRGTQAAVLFSRTLWPIQTVAVAGAVNPAWEWTAPEGGKPIIIPAGTSNGLSIRNVYARPGVQYNVEVEFTETSFL